MKLFTVLDITDMILPRVWHLVYLM